jgi:hypothetical protein
MALLKTFMANLVAPIHQVDAQKVNMILHASNIRMKEVADHSVLRS